MFTGNGREGHGRTQTGNVGNKIGGRTMKILLTMGNNEQEAIMGRGKALPDCPKTYKHISVAYHNIGDLLNRNTNFYNPRTMNVYMAKDKTLRYEIYRDGCFFPFYGKLTIGGNDENKK
jgi:hypothetical protein